MNQTLTLIAEKQQQDVRKRQKMEGEILGLQGDVHVLNKQESRFVILFVHTCS